jgi:hypothetical protein
LEGGLRRAQLTDEQQEPRFGCCFAPCKSTCEVQVNCCWAFLRALGYLPCLLVLTLWGLDPSLACLPMTHPCRHPTRHAAFCHRAASGRVLAVDCRHFQHQVRATCRPDRTVKASITGQRANARLTARARR